MKITFLSMDTNQAAEKRKAGEREAFVEKIGTPKGYALDLSGAAADNVIYGDPKKTAKEIAKEAERQDVALTQDYMAVMSQSMSEEDFAKLQKDGYQVGSMQVKDAVTIVDKIKAELLEAGVSVAGYTDTLDADTLTEITQNSALAQELTQAFAEKRIPLTKETAEEAVQALEEAKALAPMSEDGESYMIVHEKEPVIEELYLAQYSSLKDAGRRSGGYYQEENGYLTKKADTVDWESLKPQIDRILEDAGLSDMEEAKDAAKWLIDNGIALTEKSLTAYLALQKLALPIERKEAVKAVAAAVSDGKRPGQANLAERRSLWERAEAIWKRTREFTPRTADLAASKSGKLTLRSLEGAQRLIEQGYQNIAPENISARRQLEEVRLQMTILANRELLKSGYAIETAQLSEVVEALRDIESRQEQILFLGEDTQETDARAQLYAQTVETVRTVPQLPLAAVGARITEAEFTLAHVRESGERLAGAYERAQERYETLWTQPRRDMGDSIAKAFQNAQTLLEELGLDATQDNQRAVRILGYNSLAVTMENILTVKEADQALRNVIRRMTPAATLQMIREGKNPLSMNIEELDDYLDDRQQDEETQQEKYGRFLYKLEQRKEITEEEKESYIGIYRLIRQIEKSDGAVIGSLLHQGAELSFKNLLTAVRTMRAGPIDKSVDDTLGGLQEVREKGARIDGQIETAFAGSGDGKEQKDGKEKEQGYYRRMSREIYDNLNEGRLTRISPEPFTRLEAFAESLRTADMEEETDRAYAKAMAERLREGGHIQDMAAEILELTKTPVTMENALAANGYASDSAAVFRKIRREADKAIGPSDTETLREKISALEESFESRESAQEAYRSLAETEMQTIESAVYEADDRSFAEVKELGLVYKQISFTAKLADTEHYEIPILTEDSVLALHLKIIHSKEEKGTVEASIETERDGKLSVRLQVEAGRAKGLLISSQQESAGKLETLREDLKRSLTEMGLSAEELSTGIRRDLQAGFSPGKENGESREVSTNELYRTAKAMIGAMRRYAERG